MFRKRKRAFVQLHDPIINRVRNRTVKSNGPRGAMRFGGQYVIGGMMLVFAWFTLYFAVMLIGTLFFHEV